MKSEQLPLPARCSSGDVRKRSAKRRGERWRRTEQVQAVRSFCGRERRSKRGMATGERRGMTDRGGSRESRVDKRWCKDMHTIMENLHFCPHPQPQLFNLVPGRVETKCTVKRAYEVKRVWQRIKSALEEVQSCSISLHDRGLAAKLRKGSAVC